MDKIANGRAFDYDLYSMLNAPAPPSTGQIQMTITNSVANWQGLGDGVHALTGTEVLTGVRHLWAKDNGSGSGILLFSNMGSMATVSPEGSGWTISSSYQGWMLHYLSSGTGTISTTSNNSPTSGTTPSIKGPSLGSTSTSHADFAWSKGTEWDRGNM